MGVFPTQSCDSSVTSSVSSIADFELDCDIPELPLPVCEDELLDVPLPWPETPVSCGVPSVRLIKDSSFFIEAEPGGPEGDDWCLAEWTFYVPSSWIYTTSFSSGSTTDPSTTTSTGDSTSTDTSQPDSSTTTSGHSSTTTSDYSSTTTSGHVPSTTTSGHVPSTTTSGHEPPSTTTSGHVPSTTTSGHVPSTTTSGHTSDTGAGETTETWSVGQCHCNMPVGGCFNRSQLGLGAGDPFPLFVYSNCDYDGDDGDNISCDGECFMELEGVGGSVGCGADEAMYYGPQGSCWEIPK